jgi:hypothetical protein
MIRDQLSLTGTEARVVEQLANFSSRPDAALRFYPVNLCVLFRCCCCCF